MHSTQLLIPNIPRDTPLDLFCAPNMSYMAKFGIKRTYLDEPNMVDWGIPEKITLNAVQMR